MSREDRIKQLLNKLGVDGFGGVDGPRPTHNSAGIRVAMCEHNTLAPPKGWCVYCDKPHECPKPAKVSFKARNEKWCAIGLSRADLYETDEKWLFVGEICSNNKPIARVFQWIGEGEPQHPVR